MQNLNEILLGEIEGFRKLGHQFLNGEVSRADFKGASGGMGIYAHKNGKEFMIRLRMPSGVVSRHDINLVHDFAKRYGLEGIHLTTRQAIQLHGLGIDDVCDIMTEGINEGVYSRGSGGNFPRNVAISPLSGVSQDEAFDVTPYALAVGQHFLSKVYKYRLPRKLKVAFSNNEQDDPHATAVDLGFMAVKENGKEYFRVYLGGGMGRNSKVSAQISELINPEDVLYHIEAMTLLFINEGDYQNKAKARIRYIMERMGKESFIECYKEYLKKIKETENLEINVNKKVYNKAGIKTDVKNSRIVSQKQVGLYSVYVHPVGGQLKLSELERIIRLTENIEDVEIRLAMTEGLYIRNLSGKEAENILEATSDIGGTTRLSRSVACIGVPTCQMGVLNSQETLSAIVDYFNSKNLEKDILPSVHISGCPNSCAVHEVGEIGFCGKKKKINDELTEVFELHLGGELGVDKTKFGSYYGDIKKEEIPEFLHELAIKVSKSNLEFLDFIKDNETDLKEITNRFVV